VPTTPSGSSAPAAAGDADAAQRGGVILGLLRAASMKKAQEVAQGPPASAGAALLSHLQGAQAPVAAPPAPPAPQPDLFAANPLSALLLRGAPMGMPPAAPPPGAALQQLLSNAVANPGQAHALPVAPVAPQQPPQQQPAGAALLAVLQRAAAQSEEQRRFGGS
jgi:hypothetical protein